MYKVEIDPESGFCFGVVTAIRKAEEQLERETGQETNLYCLGDIVHNSDEVERLENKGLKTITHEEFAKLPGGSNVLLRAHGEPPETYRTASQRNINIIDATCPVVLRLQQRVKEAYNSPTRPQIVIYGKIGHAEVNGLVGQTQGEAIVVEDASALSQIDFTRPIALFSQTTKSLEGFRNIIREIQERISPNVDFKFYDTICRQVSNRADHLREFARAHDVVLFVAGAKSSNGKVLFNHCLSENPRTHLLENASALNPTWLEDATSIGICGATSTPRRLMEELGEKIASCVAHTGKE